MAVRGGSGRGPGTVGMGAFLTVRPGSDRVAVMIGNQRPFGDRSVRRQSEFGKSPGQIIGGIKVCTIGRCGHMAGRNAAGFHPVQFCQRVILIDPERSSTAPLPGDIPRRVEKVSVEAMIVHPGERSQRQRFELTDRFRLPAEEDPAAFSGTAAAVKKIACHGVTLPHFDLNIIDQPGFTEDRRNSNGNVLDRRRFPGQHSFRVQHFHIIHDPACSRDGFLHQ